MSNVGVATTGPPVRILVVDDNAVVRRGLRNILERQDHWKVCEEAENGREAVEKAKKFSPDIIVLDFQMPEMNGLDAAREIGRRSPEIPILMVTLHMSPQLEDEAKRVGIRGTCAKSQIGCVVDAVQALLDHRTYYHN